MLGRARGGKIYLYTTLNSALNTSVIWHSNWSIDFLLLDAANNRIDTGYFVNIVQHNVYDSWMPNESEDKATTTTSASEMPYSKTTWPSVNAGFPVTRSEQRNRRTILYLAYIIYVKSF